MEGYPGGKPIHFKTRAEAERMVRVGKHELVEATLEHQLDAAYEAGRIWDQRLAAHKATLPSTPPEAVSSQRFSGTRLVEIEKIEPSRAVQASKPVADAHKLARHGLFTWESYTPIQVVEQGGKFVFNEGMTRLANAKRSGVTHLPVEVLRRL